MNTICMNFKNSKTYDPHRLLLNLPDKIYLRTKDKYIALSNLSIYYTWQNTKKSYDDNKFKISAPHGMRNLNYLMDHILYQIFKIILNIYLKSMRKKQSILQ